MKLLSFNAGPFTWGKTRGKWSFTFNYKGMLTGGGAVNVVPTDPAQPAWHELCVLFAGPLVNIWLGSGLAAALLIPDTVDPEFRRLFELMATFSILGAIHNMMPFRLEQGSYSDGARILQILTGSPIVDVHRALLGIQSTLVTDRRPRDYDIATIERAAALYPNGFTGVHMKLCGAHHYFDLGDYDKAAEWLAEAERMVDQHKIPVSAEMHTAFVIDHALLHQDAAAVTRWFESMEKKSAEEKKPQREGVDYWLAHASLLWMQGRIDEAKACLEKADADAQRLPQAGAYEFDRSRCRQMQAVLNAHGQSEKVPATPVETEPAAYAAERWTCAPTSDEPVSFQPEWSREYLEPAAVGTEAEPPEESPYEAPIQWPRSLGRFSQREA